LDTSDRVRQPAGLMKLAHLAGSDAPLAVVADGRVAPLADRLGIATVDELIARGVDASAPAAAALEDAEPLRPGMLAAPLQAPGNIACVGLNYEDHIRETGLDRPERPLIFSKFTSTLTGPDAEIRWPAGLTEQVDWEAELAVVIGRRMQRVAVQDALSFAFGYTAANDVSARDLQFSDEQWIRGKSIDTFCPIGPVVVTAHGYDPDAKRIASRVNGTAMQESSTTEMVFSTAEILSFLSQFTTLEPGDLVLTGTPWGVGAFRDPPIFLGAGDVVEVEVEGIGVLRNPVAGPVG
jgi:2-keto-4-pentenoate hydratase/2-oxohepta-3-ene-1,7-dioic acid hydratase in catechol pathway